MQLEDYRLSYFNITTTYRHILFPQDNDISLCNISSYLHESIFTLQNIGTNTNPHLNYKNICPECLKSLPEDVLEKLKFNYIVTKLKK